MINDATDATKRSLGAGPLALPRGEGVRASGPTRQLDVHAVCPLAQDKVIDACTALQTGNGAYRALLYLRRALASDVPVLFASSRGDIEHRWQALWVLSPLLARLARQPGGGEAIGDALAEDPAPIQFFASFIDHKNSGAERLFERLRRPLLALLLGEIADASAQPKRAATLAAVIAKVDTNRDALREAIEVVLGPQAVSTILPLLVVHDARPALPGNSTAALGARVAAALRTKAAEREEAASMTRPNES